MVYLKDLKTQWPWNPNASEDFSDKEIYTHRISVEDASGLWRVPILEPMNGFAYTGVRISVYGKNSEYTRTCRLVLGATERPMFGMPWDNTIANNGSWVPLGFPLTHKMIAITEDGLDLLIPHAEPCWGRVDFVAQRFEDIYENEDQISYVFLNHRTDKVEWILDANNRMFRPRPNEEPVYPARSKLIPSVLRLMDLQRNDWPDLEKEHPRINLPVPLLH